MSFYTLPAALSYIASLPPTIVPSWVLLPFPSRQTTAFFRPAATSAAAEAENMGGPAAAAVAAASSRDPSSCVCRRFVAGWPAAVYSNPLAKL